MQRLQVIEMFEVFAKEGEIVCKSKKKILKKTILKIMLQNALKMFQITGIKSIVNVIFLTLRLKICRKNFTSFTIILKTPLA